MLIGVDFDNVIADGTIQKIIFAKEVYGVDLKPQETSKNTCLAKFDRIRYVAQDGASLSGEALYKYMMVQLCQTDRMLNYQVVPYCKEALSALIADGHRICVVTSRKQGPESGYARKFVRMHNIPCHNFFRTGSEDKLGFLGRWKFEVLIDDTYTKLVPLSGTGIIPLFFTTPQNVHIKVDRPDIIRVKNWKDTLNVIEGISGKREEMRKKVA